MAFLLQTDGAPAENTETATTDRAGTEEAGGQGSGSEAAAAGSGVDTETGTAGEPIILQDAADSYSEAAENIRQKTTEMMPDELAEMSDDFSQYKVWGVSAWELLLGFIVILISLGVSRLVIRIMDNYLKPLAQKTETDYDDKMLEALRRAVGYFVVLGGFFIAFSIIQLPDDPLDLQAGVWRVLNTLFIVLGGLLAYRIIEISLMFMAEVRTSSGQGMLDTQLVPLIRDIVKIAVIVLVVVTIIQSWGYSAAGLLTGVGIGGLALAFAAQDTVANVFGSFVIYSDKPYKVGDWISISGVEGTVEEIGIRSTRIRKFDKTIVRVPNKAVTSENIQNYSEMPIRRIKVFLGLSYETQTDTVKQVVADIRHMIGGHNQIDQNFWMVNFTEMSASSLDVLIYCFTKTTVWTEYMDVRQEILLNTIDICNSHGVDIAFPSQTIYYKSGDAGQETGIPYELARGTGRDMPKEFSAGDPDMPATPQSKKPGGPKGEFDVGEGDG